jgi:hypothetical protein
MSKNETENVAVDKIIVDGIEIRDPLKVKFAKPISFEGKEYSEIDLSALNVWTCEDRIKADKMYETFSKSAYDPMKAIVPESNLEYCLFIASQASKIPIEFFKRLPAKEGNKIKMAVVVFFNSEV